MSSDIKNVQIQSGKAFSITTQPVGKVVDIKEDRGNSENSIIIKNPFGWKKQRILTIQGSVGMNIRNTFEMNTSGIKVTGFIAVEMVGKTTTTSSVEGGIFSLIRQVEIEHGSISLNKISGKGLWLIQNLMNNGQPYILDELWNLATGGTGTKVPGTNPMYCIIPLTGLCEGNLQGGSNVKRPTFPLGATNTNLKIHIDTADPTVLTGVATVADFTLDTLKVFYFEIYDDETQNKIPNQTIQYNNIWLKNSAYYRDYIYSVDFTGKANTDVIVNCDNLVTNGEIDSFVIMSLGATQAGLKNWFSGCLPITNMKFDINSTKIYEHHNSQFARLKMLYDCSALNKINIGTGGTSTGFYYCVNITSYPNVGAIQNQVGGIGLNMNLQKGVLTLNYGTGLVDGIHTIYILAIYKAIFEILGDRSMQYRLV